MAPTPRGVPSAGLTTIETRNEGAPEIPAAPAPPPRGRRTRLAVVLAVVAAAAVGTVLKIGVEPLTALARGTVDLVREALAPAAPPPPRLTTASLPPPDALAAVPEPLRAALVRPEAEAGLSFRFQLPFGPGRICDLMAAAGLANGGWQPVERGPTHECLSDLVPVPGSVPVARRIDLDEEEGGPQTLPPQPSTLFFVARGRRGDAIDTIRFKLNLEDASVNVAGREWLTARIGDVARAMAWPVPDAVVQAIRHQRRLRLEWRGVTVEVLPEDGPVERLNVVLLLGTPATRLPADRFVDLPPLPDEMMPPDEPDPRRRYGAAAAAAVPPASTANAVPPLPRPAPRPADAADAVTPAP